MSALSPGLSALIREAQRLLEVKAQQARGFPALFVCVCADDTPDSIARRVEEARRDPWTHADSMFADGGPGTPIPRLAVIAPHRGPVILFDWNA